GLCHRRPFGQKLRKRGLSSFGHLRRTRIAVGRCTSAVAEAFVYSTVVFLPRIRMLRGACTTGRFRFALWLVRVDFAGARRDILFARCPLLLKFESSFDSRLAQHYQRPDPYW